MGVGFATLYDSERPEQTGTDPGRGPPQRGEARASYREQALKIYPWICGRCGRELTHANLRELTVHHRDHDHDNNAADGSNWELLCLYCHDNEHQRQLGAVGGGSNTRDDRGRETHSPFANLKSLLAEKKKS